MRKHKLTGNEQGFTLIELLLVMVIMGIMLAVIVPRAWRANVDSKYTLVRQNCAELVGFASNWAEQSLLAQDEDADCSLVNYYYTLAGKESSTAGNYGCWIANAGGNWSGDSASLTPTGRNAAPENTVEQVIDPSKLPRNPFNGASVFVKANDPGTSGKVVPGAVCCVSIGDGSLTTFALLFQGTDSSATVPDTVGAQPGGTESFYAGQNGTTIAGVRNGVFMARLN